MKDGSSIDKINVTFIAHTVMAIYNCLMASQIAKFRVLPEIGPGGGTKRKCDTWTKDHVVNSAFKKQFLHLDRDFCSSLPNLHAKKIDNIHHISRPTIDSTGTDQAMAQRHNDQGSCDENFPDYLPEELIEQPDNSFHHLDSFVAATEASMRFLAVPPMGGSAIISSSRRILHSDSNNNSNDITSITNMKSVENTRLVDERWL